MRLARGLLFPAAVPTPSVQSVKPVPEMVVTAPKGETRRTRLLFVSTTTALPAGSTETPRGLLKYASEPTGESKNAADPAPASVATAPVLGTIVRMRFPPLGLGWGLGGVMGHQAWV